MEDRDSKMHYPWSGNFFSSKGFSHRMRDAIIRDTHDVNHPLLF
jgi:hypothetical protein